MLILGLLGMYFDAAVVFVTSQTLFLRLALAILWVDLIIRKKEKTLQSWKICLSSKRQSILIFLSKFESFWEKGLLQSLSVSG